MLAIKKNQKKKLIFIKNTLGTRKRYGAIIEKHFEPCVPSPTLDIHFAISLFKLETASWISLD